MNELGVGIVYFQGFERFLASHSSLIDVVEIEPQTFWYDKNDACDAFKFDAGVTSFLTSYNRPKLFHGVGYPIGGTVLPPPEHFSTLKQQARALNPAWISEHLSFNIFNEQGRDVNSGFLLPPFQTEEGVKIAAANISHYRSQMQLPFAFETGANYLKPRKGEMPDGLFAARVAEEADCYILLDLHNILANQRNGRQSVKEFMDDLPYERIIEVHVGGGLYYDNYYLDAHCGPCDNELLGILEHVVGRLPNLKALMFEIDPESFTKVPESAITNQLITMRRIWDTRGFYYRKRNKKPSGSVEQPIEEIKSVNQWECTLGKLVLGHEPENVLGKELLNDGGISIMRDMIFNFRGSVLISMLKLSTRMLRLWVGEAEFKRHVETFFNGVYPELLPVVVAEQFSDYVKANELSVPYLEKVLEYELASIHNAIDQQTRSVTFDFDPMPLFAALEKAELPDEPLAEEPVVLQIAFDRPVLKSELNYSRVVHN